MRAGHLRHLASRAIAIAVATAGALAGALVGGIAVPAAAEGRVPLGGGAGIVVDGTYCTLTTIGHDSSGDLVGFTAASCGGPGASVVAEGTDTTVGTVVAANGDLDYAVIKFDPATVTPIPDFAGFAINGIGPDPEWKQPECRLGAATGDFCSRNSTLPGPGARMAMGGGNYLPGDNGAPVMSDALLVGLVTGGYTTPGSGLGTNPPSQFTWVRKFSRILDDVNATGGAGAGFTPIGG